MQKTDCNNELKSLASLVNNITELIDQEHKIIKSKDYRGYENVYKRKISLIEEFEIKTEEIRSDKSLLEAADPEVKKELREILINFKDIRDKNLEILDKELRKSEFFISVVKECVMEHLNEQSGYSRDGKVEDIEKISATTFSDKV